jgi:chemotaxis methyl-accepting protein methylase
MIYFNQQLHEKVMGLMMNSLCRFGILMQGGSEGIDHTSSAPLFEALDDNNNIYRYLGQ